jgi:hypothetical protein
MPLFTRGMRTTSKALTENKEQIQIWSVAFAGALNGIQLIARAAFGYISDAVKRVSADIKLMTAGLIDFAGIGQTIYDRYAQRTRARNVRQAELENAENIANAQFIAAGGKTGDDGKWKQEDEDKKRKEALEKQLQLVLDYNQLEIDAIKQKYAAIENLTLDDLRDLQTSVANLITDSFNKSSAKLSGQELTNARKKFDNDLAAWWQSVEDQKKDLIKKQTDDEKKAADDRLKALEDEAARKLALDKASSETRLRQLDADLKRGLILETDYARLVAAIKLGTLENEKAQLRESLKGLDIRSEKYKEIANKIALLDYQLTQQQIENARAVEEAIENATRARDRFLRPAGEEREPQDEDIFTTSPEGTPSGGNNAGIFGGLLDSIKEFFRLGEELPTLQTVFTDFANVLMNAFSGIANAIGSVIENWVLMGDTGPAMFRKIVASALASIAAESAVRAIFELAKGFAALFFNPAEAAAHFTAAALYGSIAGVAAIAGRAVAGDAFKQQTSGAYGNSTSQAQDAGRGGDVYSTNRDKQILELSRNASASVPEDKFVIRDRSGIFSDFFEVEVYRNGKLRDVIRATANE